MATPGQLLLGAGAAILAYNLFKPKRRRSNNGGASTSSGTDSSAPPPPPPPPPPPTGDYVGSPGFNWARKDRFPNETSFIAWLANNGYPVATVGNVLSEQNMTAVRDFQSDFNLIKSWAEPRFNVTLQANMLEVDGLIGNQTIAAMVAVDDQVLAGTFLGPGTEWPALVANVKQQVLNA